MLAQLCLLALISLSIMWIAGGKAEFPWLPTVWTVTLVTFIGIRANTLKKNWKQIYHQALKENGYAETFEKIGGDLSAQKPAGRLKGAERAKARKAAEKRAR
jgi:hypothetical protein